jgi:hypothetical protein
MGKTTPNKAKKKRIYYMSNRITSDDIVMAFMFRKDIHALLTNSADPVGILNKAIVKIKEHDELTDVQDLHDIKKVYEKAKGTRGKSALGDGETRSYKAQEVNGSVFIRLPLDSVKLKKGDLVTVSLNGGVFTVRSKM